MHSNWRDFDAWRSTTGLKFDTSNNEACKLYDVALTQYSGWYEIEEFGGLNGTIEKLLNADQDFLMGHVIDLGLQMLTCPENVESYESKLRNLNQLKTKKDLLLSKRDKMHVQALNLISYGDLPAACECWESILLDNPKDLLALRFAHDAYFYLGYHRQMRDSVAHVLPLWKSSDPLYSYLYGYLSFGLSQTGQLSDAEKNAKKGLELNKNDAWSTHTICHVNEYLNRADDGIKFLRDTENDWSICNLVAKHNYWHLSLFHLEKNEHDISLDIFDKNIFPTDKLDSYFDMVDACALLYRLKLDNCKDANDKSERWLKVKNACMPMMNGNGFAFNDLHLFMSASACGDNETKKSFMDTFNDYIANDDETINESTKLSEQFYFNRKIYNYLKSIKKDISSKLLEAIECYDNSEYDKVVELVYPIRYEIIKIGGSNAQRDVFHQLLTQSALRSTNEYNKKIGLSLLHERILYKPNSKLNERITARFVSLNDLS